MHLAYETAIEGAVQCLWPMPNGHAVIAGGAEGGVRVVGNEIAHAFRYAHAVACQALAALPDGRIAFSIGLEGSLGRMDFESGTWAKKRLESRTAQALAVTATGRVLLAAGKTVQTCETSDADMRLQTVDRADGVIAALAARPVAGGFVAAHARGVTLYGSDLRRETFLPSPGICLGLVLSGDGRFAAAPLHDKSVHVWELATGRDWSMQGFERVPQGVAFSPQAEWIGVASGTGITLWNLEGEGPGGQSPLEFSAHRSTVRNLVFLPDGHRFASGGDDGLLLLWSLSADGTGSARKNPPRKAPTGRLVEGFPAASAVTALCLASQRLDQAALWVGLASGEILQVFGSDNPCA